MTTEGRRPLSAIPPQHGAWALLALPIVVAVSVAPRSAAQLLLATAWVTAYAVSYFVLAAIGESRRRTPQWSRYARPAAPWLIGFLASAVPLVIMQPWLLVAALPLVALWFVSAIFARRHAQRALANDVIPVAQCTAMVPITWAVGQGVPEWAQAPRVLWWLTAFVALALVGSILHVRTFLRARGDARVAHAAVAVALAGIALACIAALLHGITALVMIVPFGYFTIRAVVLQHRADTGAPLRPAIIGMIDLGGFVLVTAAAWAWAG